MSASTGAIKALRTSTSVETLKDAAAQSENFRRAQADYQQAKKVATHSKKLLHDTADEPAKLSQMFRTQSRNFRTSAQAGETEGYSQIATAASSARNDAFAAFGRAAPSTITQGFDDLASLADEGGLKEKLPEFDKFFDDYADQKKQVQTNVSDTMKTSLFPRLAEMSQESQDKIPANIKPAFNTWKALGRR